MTETKLKAVNIEATFPELKGRFSTPTGRGHATNVSAARANAMHDLLKQVICNLFGRSHALGRNVCLEEICFVFLRLRKAVEHPCFRRTRTNNVDTNPCAGEFDGCRLRDAL